MEKIGSRRGREQIGILGGSFNPIHNGHLLAAEAFMEKLRLDRLFLVPSARPPHKESGILANANHRYIMTRMAVCSQQRFEVSGMELERPGHSFTVDTIGHFRSLYPDADLHFMMGWDAWQLIGTWKEPDRLAAMCASIVVVNRPGSGLESPDPLQTDFENRLAEKLLFIEIPLIDISSTVIRRRIREQLPIAYMVPSAVERYIISNDLYKEPGDEGIRGHQ